MIRYAMREAWLVGMSLGIILMTYRLFWIVIPLYAILWVAWLWSLIYDSRDKAPAESEEDDAEDED